MDGGRRSGERSKGAVMTGDRPNHKRKAATSIPTLNGKEFVTEKKKKRVVTGEAPKNAEGNG